MALEFVHHIQLDFSRFGNKKICY